MAGVGTPMQITAVDKYNNLFCVTDMFPAHIVEQVLSTPWSDLAWRRQEGQETWRRRRINDGEIAWQQSWDQHLQSIWPDIAQAVGRDVGVYIGTGWWLDEPGFTCSMHTDGEMPGSLHMTWIADTPALGTSFYHFNDQNTTRHHFLAQANTGYIMINMPDANQARHLQWHAMLTPVPADTIRVSSYTWIQPK
jgi:hypothetical protein